MYFGGVLHATQRSCQLEQSFFLLNIVCHYLTCLLIYEITMRHLSLIVVSDNGGHHPTRCRPNLNTNRYPQQSDAVFQMWSSAAH